MINKRVLIIVLLFVISAVVGLVLSSSVKKSGGQIVSPSPTPYIGTSADALLPTPLFTAPITYSLPQLPSFPPAITALTVASSSPLETVPLELARQLGLVDAPEKTTSSRGEVLRWISQNRSLIYMTDRGVLTYTSGANASAKILLGEDELRARAVEFFRSVGLSSYADKLVYTGSTYLSPTKEAANPVTSIKEATVVRLNFQYKIGDALLYTEKIGTGSDAWVQIDNKGVITSFSFVVLPSIENSSSVPIVSMETAADRLVTNKGVLAGVAVTKTGDEPVLIDAPPENISVDRIEVAYFYSKKANALAPVFVFRGTGVVKGERVKTLTIVSAAPQ